MPTNPGNTFVDALATQPGHGTCVSDVVTVGSGLVARIMQTNPTRLFCSFKCEPSAVTAASVGHARLGGSAKEVGSGLGYLLENGSSVVWDGCTGEMWCYAQGGAVQICMMTEIRR